MDSLAETEPARTTPKIINTTLCISLLQFFVDDVSFLSFGVTRSENPESRGLTENLILNLSRHLVPGTSQ
jgi:hypothetical protein